LGILESNERQVVFPLAKTEDSMDKFERASEALGGN
jgi:hypothetical protein